MENADAKADQVLAFVAAAAKKHMQAKAVWLFGSRARGDHRPRSDYDIAVDAPSASNLEWLRFCDEVMEHAPTLCAFDLLWLQQTIDHPCDKPSSVKDVHLHKQPPDLGKSIVNYKRALSLLQQGTQERVASPIILAGIRHLVSHVKRPQ